MPRLTYSLLWRAYGVSPLLPLLLKTCRTLSSAANELRWLKEHVQEIYHGRKHGHDSLPNRHLLSLCRKRSRGVPLQYLLGSQPFGELEILCRPGVLIPRPETEAYTTHLAKLLPSFQDPVYLQNTVNTKPIFRVLDLCTGTGCIPLLLHSLLWSTFPNLELHGVDISSQALALAGQNLRYNLDHNRLKAQAEKQISFHQGDILSEAWTKQGFSYDVVISNPPYISSSAYWRDTSKSVRNYEPKLALVPRPITNCDPSVLSADVFYPKIIRTAALVRAKVVLMEVADLPQAIRVAGLAVQGHNWKNIEIWRDWPDQEPDADEQRELVVQGKRVTVKGSGQGRSVVCWG